MVAWVEVPSSRLYAALILRPGCMDRSSGAAWGGLSGSCYRNLTDETRGLFVLCPHNYLSHGV